MLGMGWFPATLGGLDRYYRSLLEQLPEATGVVIGPAEDAPASVEAVARTDCPLVRRLFAFWQAARRVAPDIDVVDAHFALYALAPLLFGALRTRPVVCHFQGPWAEESIAAGDTSRMKLRLRRTLERRVLRHADAHVVLSSAFRRLLVERYHVLPWDIHVWAPGVSLDVFTPGDRSRARARLGIDPSAFVAVCVRRLVPRMGIDGLLDAWGRLEDDLLDSSVLLIAGDGPLREELAERAARPPLAGRVRVLGRLSDPELIDVYRSADVATVPTVVFEGFGLVVLEAAACGTPSIVSDVGGLPEVTVPLDPSLVVAPADAEALSARLEAAAQGALPSRAATRRYAESFNWTTAAGRHRNLYRRLAGGDRDRRPRVVYLDHVARLSGGEIALLRLLPHLRRTNSHVILGEDGPLTGQLQLAGISVEVLPIATSARDVRKDTVRVSGVSPIAILNTLTYIARLARRLRELRPDLVHTNSLKSGVYGGLAAKVACIPTVWHVRDRISDDYLPGSAVRLVQTLIRHLADGVVANSAATLDTLSAADRGRAHWVIPDSIEISTHPRAPEPKTTTFGMLGRIAPWKGQDLFLRAFAAAFPAGSERAVVVGTPLFGEESYERELHNLAARLGLADRVEFRGFREDIWPELASFDVLVHASVTPEPFGQVVLEGMAAGLPVIAPDEGGPATMLADGETGRLFRSRNLDSLAAAMRTLRDDPRERERLGTAARGAIADYHPDAVAQRLERVYEQVLRKTRHGAGPSIAG
jgi:glycosyltransferase involved in cell wall biosynthesis